MVREQGPMGGTCGLRSLFEGRLEGGWLRLCYLIAWQVEGSLGKGLGVEEPFWRKSWRCKEPCGRGLKYEEPCWEGLEVYKAFWEGLEVSKAFWEGLEVSCLLGGA